MGGHPHHRRALPLISIIIWLSIIRDSGRLSRMDVHPTSCILSSRLLAIAISPTLTAEILRRLRIGHTRLTHQYLLRREEPTQCPSCNCALTVVRISLECQQYEYNSVRQKYFSVTTLKELFDRVNFDDILSFLRDIHLYSSI